ncbi:DUF4340 domain-containing protein [bacterium]|nr:DUF4340 domain-containing protein [bacterium]
MKKSTWIVLEAFVLILIAYLVIQNAPPAVEETPTPTAQPTLRYLDDMDIQSITYTDADGAPITVEKDAELLWHSPTDPEANVTAGKIEELIANLSELRLLSTLPEDASMAALGLAQPTFTIEFGFEDQSTYLIEIGDETPLGDGYYARIDQGKIVALPAESVNQVHTIFFDFIAEPTHTPPPDP